MTEVIHCYLMKLSIWIHHYYVLIPKYSLIVKEKPAILVEIVQLQVLIVIIQSKPDMRLRIVVGVRKA